MEELQMLLICDLVVIDLVTEVYSHELEL